MTKKTVKSLTAGILVFLVVSVLYLIAGLLAEFLTGKTRVEHNFNELVLDIQNNFDKTSFTKYTDKEKGFASIKIYKNTDSLFIFPLDNNYEYQESSLIKLFSTEIKSDNDVYHVQTALQLMRPYKTFSVIQLAFILILTATLLAGALLIAIAIEEKKGKLNLDAVEDADDSNKEEEDETEALTDTAEPKALEVSQEKPETKSPEELMDKIKSVKEESPFEANKIDYDSIIDNAQPSEDEMITFDNFNTESTEKQDQPAQEADNTVSYTLNVNSRQELNESLERELKKASSNEEDLSLFLIKVPGMQKNSKEAYDLSEKIKEVFLTNDGVFEYEDDSFAVSKSNLSIDQAEDFADSIFAELKKSVSTLNQTPFIGISSRSTRMLSAERLIKEADEALVHSLEDPALPIIGFHVDIEKYREFLKNSQ